MNKSLINIYEELNSAGIDFEIKNNKFGVKFIGENNTSQKENAKKTFQKYKEIIKERRDELIDLIIVQKYENQEKHEYNNLSKSFGFNKFNIALKKEYRYNIKDGRDDTVLWEKVLKIADKKNKKLFNLLHYLMLSHVVLKTEKNQIKFDSKETLKNVLKEDNLYWNNKNDYLLFMKKNVIPYNSEIKQIFTEAYDKEAKKII
ncbi:MAG: hypothetical protein ACOCRX_10730 [Candidatus Woesearchaeota archaeon]